MVRPVNYKYVGCEYVAIIYLTMKISKVQAPSLLNVGTNQVNLRDKDSENRT